MISVIPEPGEI